MRLLFGLLFTLAFVFSASPEVAAAQDPATIGSRLLPLGSWTYEPIEQLRTRGHLSGLNPLAQPYRRIDVAVGLAHLREVDLSGPVAGWVELLATELARELEILETGRDGQDLGFQLVLGGTASDSRRRDPLVPYRTTADETARDRLWPLNSGAFWLEHSNVAAEARVAKDLWTHSPNHGDPDGFNPGGAPVVGRTDNAYFTAAFAWGNVWLGRFQRNWGPLGQLGTMLGDDATPYPQIGLDLGRGRFSFQFIAGELETVAGRKRYVVANRVDYRTENFHVGIGESALTSGEVSPLRLINPVEFIFFDQRANNGQKASGNLMLNAMVWARAGNVTFYGEAALDDFDLLPRTGKQDRGIEATSYQVSAGARYFGVREDIVLGLDYRRVSAWSYRSGVEAEQWMYLNRGLGDPWSDYDRLTARLDFFPSVRGLRLSPVVQYQRAGEGDYRIPFPPREEQLTLPGIFHGVLETTKRVGVQGRFQPRRELFIEWDAGRSFITNAGHVGGLSEQRFSFLLRLAFTFEAGL